MRASISPVPQRNSKPTANLPSLALIQSELTEVSLSLSITCSIANAGIARRPCQYSIAAMFKFAPTSDGLMKCLELAETGDEIDSNVANAVTQLISQIGLARSMTAIVMRTSAPELMGALAECWNRAASACVVAGILIERELPTGLVDEQASPAGIRRLLREACGGASPCIDQNGALFIPGWAERRVGARCETRRHVTLVCNEAEGPGTVTNVSTAGMKIETNLSLTVGSEIMVGTDDGVWVKGYVIWTHGDEVGIEADTLIDPVDFVKI